MIYWLQHLFPADIISIILSLVENSWVFSSTSCELKAKIPALMHPKFLNTNNYITKTGEEVPPSCVSLVVFKPIMKGESKLNSIHSKPLPGGCFWVLALMELMLMFHVFLMFLGSPSDWQFRGKHFAIPANWYILTQSSAEHQIRSQQFLQSTEMQWQWLLRNSNGLKASYECIRSSH